jgi:Uma2 family endonuclease
MIIMTTTLTPPTTRRPTLSTLADRGGVVLIPNMSWRSYTALCDTFQESQVFLTYDHGWLEIRMPSTEHERPSFLIDNLLGYLTRLLRIPIDGVGSTTFRHEAKACGVESDGCYYLAHAHQSLGKQRLDLETDPPPDLAVEIDISSSSIPRLPIYAALGIPEVWRYDGQHFEFLLLQPDETYQAAGRSRALPQLTPELVLSWVKTGAQKTDHAMYDAIDAWWQSQQAAAKN